MYKSYHKDLLDRYLKNQLSENELKEFLAGSARGGNRKLLKESFSRSWEEHKQDQREDTELRDRNFQNLMNRIGNSGRTSKRNDSSMIRLTRWGMTWQGAVAASLLLLACSTFFILRSTHSNKNLPLPGTALTAMNSGIIPGGTKAVLTLSNGASIVLDTAQNGILVKEAATRVEKTADGKLLYSQEGKTSEILYNSLSTPRGGEYKLALADGSIAWLNAASSIRFPVSFEGIERRVEITGEVYFEVAKNAEMPFRVAVGDMTIEVLGTHFNVAAYPVEGPVRTTLLEGSVRVNQGDSGVILAPGQQACVDSTGSIRMIDNVDVDQVVAWTSGWFEFDGEGIESIMRQISRWYNVDIVYEGPVNRETFSGIVSRKSDVSQVLKIMEQAGIKFKLETDKITVIN